MTPTPDDDVAVVEHHRLARAHGRCGPSKTTSAVSPPGARTVAGAACWPWRIFAATRSGDTGARTR